MLQQSGGAPTNRLTSVTTSGVTANYTYDSAGNVTNDGSHAYIYDGENRMVSVDSGGTATYAYDTSNQRYKKATGGATTHYVWQGSQVIAEHNGSTGAVVTDYVYSGSRMIANVSAASTQYFLSDRLSARMTLDTSGSVLGRQAHLPLGEDFAENGTQEKRHFTGYERDSESGTDYAVNRQYDQSIGRFRQVDPEVGYASNPQSLNRNSYVQGDPINKVDPLGLCFWWEQPDGPAIWSCDSNRTGNPRALPRTHEPPQIPKGPMKVPCFVKAFPSEGIGKYSMQELLDATITVFGEMSSHFNKNSGFEAGAIISLILNRSEAIANRTAPGSWGSSSSLSDVVQAPGQFAGFSAGISLLKDGTDLAQGERNCDRLQQALGAVFLFAMHPELRNLNYTYMCAHGHLGRPFDPATDVEINRNIFSSRPLGCHP